MKNYAWLMAALLCACGEISYKRGANVAQLENTRSACEAKASEAAIEKCMRDNGWIIQKLDTFELLTETKIKTDQAQLELANNELANKELDGKELDSKDSSSGKAVATHDNPQANNTKASSVPKKVAINPLDTYVVSSWWKAGAKPDNFQADSNTCVKKLGDAHKPVGKTQTATAGFIVCMSESGWKSLAKK